MKVWPNNLCGSEAFHSGVALPLNFALVSKEENSHLQDLHVVWNQISLLFYIKKYIYLQVSKNKFDSYSSFTHFYAAYSLLKYEFNVI